MLEKLFNSSSNTPTPEQEKAKQEAEQQELHAQLEQELSQISKTEDSSKLSTFATDSSFTKARQAAAEKINDSDMLHELEKNSQDKAVQHIVREKIKALKTQDNEQQQSQQETESLCIKIEQLAKHHESPLFKAQHEHLQKEWVAHTENDSPEAHLQKRFEDANTICTTILSDIETTKTENQAKQEQAALIKEQTEAKAKIDDAEKTAQQEQAAEKKQLSKEEKDKHSKEQELLERSLLEQIKAIEDGLENGKVSNISKKLTSIQKKSDQLDSAIAKRHEGKIQLLRNKLNELRDWQSYAAMPKKQELCEKMQLLVEKEMAPKELADAIQSLQAEWRELKGGGKDEEQKLWETFKELADKAYEPCKVHFNQLRDLRKENKKQRENICAELQQFHTGYDWDNADWKAVDKIIEKSKREFHRFTPIDHKHQKNLKEKFSAALSQLQDKLLPEQKKHEAEKQQLIEEAASLSETTDVQAAMNATKQLQQQWKLIGITRHHKDQKLWQQFRSACDAVFSKRGEEREKAHKELSQDIQKAEEICRDIEKLCALTDEELKKSRDSYQQLRSEFLSISNLHKEKQRRLFNQFYKTCDHYQAQVKGIKQRQEQNSLQEAFRKIALCAQLELGNEFSEIDAQWESEVSLTADIKKILEKRYTQAKQINSGDKTIDFADNEAQCRLVLIQLEILLDKSSPEEDKSLRMKYQLQQLSNKGLSGKTENDKNTAKQMLLLQWLACGSASKETQEQLQQRLELLTQS